MDHDDDVLEGDGVSSVHVVPVMHTPNPDQSEPIWFSFCDKMLQEDPDEEYNPLMSNGNDSLRYHIPF